MPASQLPRRQFLTNFSRLVLGSATLTPLPNIYAQNSPLDHEVIVTDLEVIVVNVTQRTKWIFVLLTASNGVTGLGEASLGRRSELNELNSFFRLVEGQSPFDINLYRTKGWPRASSGNRAVATAFSAIEQALWDIVGKTRDVPVYQLFGRRLRDSWRG